MIDPHYLPRPGPTQSTLPRRYEPYRSSSSHSFPRRLIRPPTADIPRLPPVPHSTPSPEIRVGPKNYDPLRPEGLYQASKGARRDIKWMQKHVERSPPERATQPDVHRRPYPPRTSISDLETLPPPHPPRGLIGVGPPRRYSQQLKPPPIPNPERCYGPGWHDIKGNQAVKAARKFKHARPQDEKQIEWERKVKRIQMQVFVHAR